MKTGNLRWLVGGSLFLLVVGGAPSLLTVAEAVARFLAKSVPVTFYSAEILGVALIETVLMALVGTCFGFAMALVVVAIKGGSGRSGTWLAGGVPLVLRAIPDFVIALILAQVLGVGPLAGALAIALGTLGVSFKTIDQLYQARDKSAGGQLEMIGVSRIRRIFAADLPLLARELRMQFSFRFEINLRIATVIGITGAGGLGLLLRKSLGVLDYSAALGTVLTIILAILSFDYLVKAWNRFSTLSSKGSFSNPGSALSPLLLLGMSSLVLVNWTISSETEVRWEQINKVMAALVDFVDYQLPSTFFDSILQSLHLTFASAGISFVGALLLGSLASKRFSPFGKVAGVIRVALSLLRSMPTIVWALILIPAFGLGQEVGLAAMMVGSTLFFARSVLDLLDSHDYSDLSQLSNIGVRRWQVLLVAFRTTLAQRSYLTFFLLLDFCLRYSVILGILGVGGLGAEINNALRLQDFATVTLVSAVLVTWLLLVELVGAKLTSDTPEPFVKDNQLEEIK